MVFTSLPQGITVQAREYSVSDTENEKPDKEESAIVENSTTTEYDALEEQASERDTKEEKETTEKETIEKDNAPYQRTQKRIQKKQNWHS
jgi:hypothetical protein